MNKKRLAFILGISSFIMLPTYAHGEEQNNEKRGLLSGTVTELIEKTENITEEVNSTLPVRQIEEPTKVAEPVVEIVEKVEGKTTPIVEKALIEVPPITESIVSEVGSIVEETIEVVPKVPIVTPVLTEVNGSVKKVTSKVQETVEEGSSTVQAAIGKKEIPIVEEKRPAAVEPQKQAEEPRVTDKVFLVEESNLPQESTSLIDPPEETVSVPAPVIKEPPQQSQPTVDEEITIIREESFEHLQANQEKKIIEKAHKKEIKKSTNKSSSVLPPIPDSQQKKVVVTTVSTTSTSAPSSGSNLGPVQSGDTLFALLPSQEPMKELMRKKWYHKNHYAIIQWIHTPLRKPPEMSPFYT